MPKIPRIAKRHIQEMANFLRANQDRLPVEAREQAKRLITDSLGLSVPASALELPDVGVYMWISEDVEEPNLTLYISFAGIEKSLSVQVNHEVVDWYILMRDETLWLKTQRTRLEAAKIGLSRIGLTSDVVRYMIHDRNERIDRQVAEVRHYEVGNLSRTVFLYSHYDRQLVSLDQYGQPYIDRHFHPMEITKIVEFLSQYNLLNAADAQMMMRSGPQVALGM